MRLSGTNTYTGATNVNGGTLAISGGGTISESSAIAINDTGTLRFDKNDTFGNADTDTSSSITVNAGGTIESNGFFTTIRDLNLNGGTVALTGGVSAQYPAIALKGTVTVGGSQASQINYVSGNFSRISIGDNNLGATVFDVADATGDASADLTIGAVVQNNSPIGGNSLTKNGAGTMELTSTNTYTGTTTVNEGTLRMVNSATGYAIRGGHNYSVASGATLEFNRIGGLDSPGTFNLSGSGIFKKSGSEEIIQTSAGSNVNMGSGALFHVESGIYRFGADGIGDWSSNLSDMQVDSGATFNGAATPTVVDALNGSGTVITSGGITVGVDNGTGSFSGVITDGTHNGTPSFTKNGSGTQTLSGNNTYTGDTTVNGGTLVIDGNQASATGAITINVNGSLAGSGTIGASLLTVKGVLAPGNSPGTLATGDQLWNDGGSYLWEINDSDGSKGLSLGGTNGWDWLDINGDLNLGSLSAGGFTIDIDSLNSSDLAGTADGFDYSGLAYGDAYGTTFIIATADTITGFDASLFTFDDSDFINGKLEWNISESGTDLVLSAVFVPEPSSTALLGLGGLALMLRRKR
jgi:fibronectin-binding autotransporter adhesin